MNEESKFEEKFLNLPSSFSLKIEELWKSKYTESQKKQLELKCETREFETPTEWIRVHNILSFLHWKTENREKAYEHNIKALELEKENIVALCNRVWMQWHDGQLTEANEELAEVERLVESKQDLLLEGKAEIAYAYSTFGPRYFSQSINMYDKVMGEIADKKIDAKRVQLWKLDLGIIYRKFCNSGSILPKQDWRERNINDCIEKAAHFFYEVISSNAPARWKGRCFASLAELSYQISIGIHDTKSQNDLFPMEIADKDVNTLLNLALEECAEDSHVLKICGKLFKYLKKLDKAEEILRKSLMIRETSHGHHHLALVLKKRLMNRIFETKRSGEKHKYISFKTNVDAQGVLYQRNEQPDQANTSDLHLRNVESQISTVQKRKKATIKGFSYVFIIPAHEKETVDEIMLHLDEAIQFGNEWASVDKGLMLRHIKEHRKAFDTFLKTLSMREISNAAVTVSCYEHLGACCRDLAEKEVDPDKRRKLNSDSIIYFRKAIETIAYKASQELNYLKDGWMAYSSLKDMFHPQGTNTERLKILAELSTMLRKYGETLEFYDQIIRLDEEQANDPVIIRGKIQIYLEQRRFEEAAVLLDLQSCTEGKQKLNEEFCKLVYLKYAFHLLCTGKKEDSGQRFRQALTVGYAVKSGEETDFDIFFLYDEDVEPEKEGKPMPASAVANKFKEKLPGNPGLRITRNSENVKPGRWTRQEQAQQMESSTNIILILDTNEEPQGELKYFIKIAQTIDKEKRSKLSLILLDGCTCPRELTAFPMIYLETKLLQDEDKFIQWVQKFFYRLLDVNENEN